MHTSKYISINVYRYIYGDMEMPPTYPENDRGWRSEKEKIISK